MNKLTEKQIEKLLNDAKLAIDNGESLCSVFEKNARKYGLAKGSVRNIYYRRLKDGVKQDLSAKKIEKFTKNEELWLIRQVICERKNYNSMRELFLSLANGDKKLALRFQNKYCTIVKNNRNLVIREILSRKRFVNDCFNPYIDKKMNSERLKLKREIDQLIKKITKKCEKENAELKQKLEKYERLSNLKSCYDMLISDNNQPITNMQAN